MGTRLDSLYHLHDMLQPTFTMARIPVVSILLLLLGVPAYSQSTSTDITSLQARLADMESEMNALKEQINEQKWVGYKDSLLTYGLPSASYLDHTAYYFAYSEEHEQAEWVSHIIAPEVIELGSGRTNDFRPDPQVSTGTTDSIDYFAYDASLPEDRRYSGYGYDRGHLAASADFRWYRQALSESYYYSNISPQVAEFNRNVWADLEALLRRYVIVHGVPIAVVTAPVLVDDLPKIDQSPNGVSIPRQFVKIAYDATNHRSVAFLMDNKELENPPSYYALSVDEVEALTGYDYFPNIDEEVEQTVDHQAWFAADLKGNATPVQQNRLSAGYFNTTAGRKQAKSDKIVHVCGTVVGTRYSSKGHGWLNLDKKFPDKHFSIMIRKEELVNFPFDPVVTYAEQQMCFEGRVEQWGDLVVMQVDKPQLAAEMVVE